MWLPAHGAVEQLLCSGIGLFGLTLISSQHMDVRVCVCVCVHVRMCVCEEVESIIIGHEAVIIFTAHHSLSPGRFEEKHCLFWEVKMCCDTL